MLIGTLVTGTGVDYAPLACLLMGLMGCISTLQLQLVGSREFLLVARGCDVTVRPGGETTGAGVESC